MSSAPTVSPGGSNKFRLLRHHQARVPATTSSTTEATAMIHRRRRTPDAIATSVIRPPPVGAQHRPRGRRAQDRKRRRGPEHAGGMRSLTVLGSCGGYPEPERACSGFLVEWDDFRLVLDLGYGTLPRLLSAGPLVDAVVITHEHPDHCV